MRWGITVAAALVFALCLAPASASAAPLNDDFANRTVLSGALPIEQGGSNVGATSETGEPTSGVYGKSVWFEWEAPATGWSTIGACDSNFAASVAVFTGTELEDLARVSGDGAAEGPDCGNQSQFTFRATEGAKYVIRVDGAVIAPPEGSPPPSEGAFTLKIEETPAPPNDDFANATVLEASVAEEPGGTRFYGLFTRAYNWNATTEAGEFPYGANSGASVWYRWTPPETAKYELRGACGSGLNFALFSGGFGLENEMLAATCSAEVSVTGGATYWISVYGTPNLSTGEPWMTSFGFSIAAQLPPLPSNPPPLSPPASGPAPDTTPPETKIDKSQLRISARSAKFWFSASEATQSFLCRLDKGGFKPCNSPRTYKHLKPGRHAFRVKAVDVAGNVDGSAAVAKFKIPKPHHGRR
jgi:hypothetical protein